MVDLVDERDALGDEARDDEPGARADVGGLDRRTERRSRPRTTAWWPSVRMSAPRRSISLTNMNRLSKTFSVTIAVPSRTDASAMAIGCRSVGKPGYGSVDDVDRARPAVHPHPEAVRQHVDRAPARVRVSSAISRCAASAPRTMTSPRVVAAPNAQVPATTRSDTVTCSVPCSASTPVISRVGRADAVDARAHLDEHPAEVDDLGLARGVVDDGDAVGEHRGHQHVLGGADAREVEPAPGRRCRPSAQSR